jgi:hypothetical protein
MDETQIQQPIDGWTRTVPFYMDGSYKAAVDPKP